MNMLIINITPAGDTKVEDKVVLIGKQDELEIKVSTFSEISNELNYEVLAHLSESIKKNSNINIKSF